MLKQATYPALVTTAAGSCLLLRLRLPRGAATWVLVSGILVSPAIWPHPIPDLAMILLASSFTLAAWLIDHLPAGQR